MNGEGREEGEREGEERRRRRRREKRERQLTAIMPCHNPIDFLGSSVHTTTSPTKKININITQAQHYPESTMHPLYSPSL